MEFSKENDFVEKQDVKLSWYTRFTIRIAIFFIRPIVSRIMGNIVKQREFDKKYKTVIKENWLGFTSKEFHER